MLKDSTEHLKEPEMLVTLKEEKEVKEFWATVPQVVSEVEGKVIKQEHKSCS